jgi:hypothetical protein
MGSDLASSIVDFSMYTTEMKGSIQMEFQKVGLEIYNYGSTHYCTIL